MRLRLKGTAEQGSQEKDEHGEHDKENNNDPDSASNGF